MFLFVSCCRGGSIPRRTDFFKDRRFHYHDVTRTVTDVNTYAPVEILMISVSRVILGKGISYFVSDILTIH